MKTLYYSIIAIVIVSLPLIVIAAYAQCYGCGQNSSVLNQALLEKQTEEIQQKNEQLDQDSQIIILLIGVSVTISCVTGIVIWILFKNRKISNK